MVERHRMIRTVLESPIAIAARPVLVLKEPADGSVTSYAT